LASYIGKDGRSYSDIEDLDNSNEQWKKQNLRYRGKDGNEFVGAVVADSDQQENSGEALAMKNPAGENITYLVPNDVVFVKRTYSEANTTAGLFDDIIVWESPYVLYSKMIEAGQLP